jgi:hypothetical protein
MREIEPTDDDKFQFRQLGNIAIAQSHDSNERVEDSLIAVSSKYGYIIIGKDNSFLFGTIEAVTTQLKQGAADPSVFATVPVEGVKNHPIHSIVLSPNELYIAVAAGLWVRVFDVRGLAKKVRRIVACINYYRTHHQYFPKRRNPLCLS